MYFLNSNLSIAHFIVKYEISVAGRLVNTLDPPNNPNTLPILSIMVVELINIIGDIDESDAVRYLSVSPKVVSFAYMKIAKNKYNILTIK